MCPNCGPVAKTGTKVVLGCYQQNNSTQTSPLLMDLPLDCENSDAEFVNDNDNDEYLRFSYAIKPQGSYSVRFPITCNILGTYSLLHLH